MPMDEWVDECGHCAIVMADRKRRREAWKES
jgi:hypothetical protein